MRIISKRVTRGLALLGVIVPLTVLAAITSAHATPSSWLTGTINGEVSGAGPETCTKQTVRIGSPTSGEQGEVCVYQAKHFQYGYYEPSGGSKSFVVGFAGETAMYKVLGMVTTNPLIPVPESDTILTNVPTQTVGYNLQIIKDLPSKLEKTTEGASLKTAYTLKDNAYETVVKNESGNYTLTGKAGASENGKWLVVELIPGGFLRINMETNEKVWFSKYTQPYNMGYDPFYEYAVSNDGRYVTISGRNTSPKIYELQNCGRTITVFQEAWRSTDNNEDINECPNRDISRDIGSKAGGTLIYTTKPSFRDIDISGDALELTLKATSVYQPDPSYQDKWVTLTAPGYTSPPRLDYLALGDSYSSGEGDTEKNAQGDKYYRPYTNNEENKAAGIPREKCHVSTRSYPYLLAKDMNLAKDNPQEWDTVACSGATAWDVKKQASDEYKGQGKGAAKPWSNDKNQERLEDYDVTALKAQALNEIIPGRQKQIAFVKKYKPKAITLTMGGNDVGFGDMIQNCLMPFSTCNWATEEGRKNLGQKLQYQFKNLTSLYEELHASSQSTKIYVLGYPQAINGTASTTDCVGYSVGLDSSERHVVAEGYSYLDKVIEAATKYAGVKYVDIEHALDGHRICDGASEHYVTGFTLGYNIFNPSLELQESFHPNAKGHKSIANKIEERLEEGGTNYNLLTYPYIQTIDHTVTAPVPAPTDYLAWDTTNTKPVATKQITPTTSVQKGAPFSLAIDAYNFAIGSVAHLLVHSDPVDLGDYTVNADGSLTGNATIPANLSPGYHTLILTGQSYSGEPIQYEQVIFVHGAGLNDLDENNIPDSQQPCGPFLTASGQDQDADGLDDACDPEIGPAVPKEPYRMRAGDPSKTYAGSPEATSALYLERNIYTTDKTGVSGDYDPDHDGWVVIATNQPTSGTLNVPIVPPLAPYAHFWLEDSISTNNGTTITTKLPHISFRTPNNGCVQYKPANLGKVTEAEVTAAPLTPRGFTQEAVDTNTCRTEPPTADADNNGQPDNTQPLYRARNGNSTLKHTKPDGTPFYEDPTKLYIERSTRAAEAQLGKSDYASNDSALLAAAGMNPNAISPTNTKDYREAWSILATSPAYTYSSLTNNFTKLRMITSYPYALTGYTSMFYTNCSAYKPENVGTIRQTTQYTQLLQADWMTGLILTLQGGCNG